MIGSNIFHMSNNAYMMYVPHPDLQDAASLEHMNKLYKARQAFAEGFLSGMGESNLDKERIYYELYEDIKAHQDDFWFARVFCQGMESKYAEWTIGILGTMATIRRQRGDVQACLEILKLDTKVLGVYHEIADYNIPSEKECVRGLTYKYNLIVVNANTQVRNKEVAIKAFREAVKFEIEEGYDFEQQNLGFMLDRFEGDEYMAIERLDCTTDDFIWSSLTAMIRMGEGNTLPVEPKLCDYCGKEEEMCGDFKKCSACHKTFYCNKECQTLHWKMLHKQECRNKLPKRVNVSDDSFKTVAKMLTDNFAETARVHTGKEVSDEHKQAAFPKLVKLLKEFVLSHEEFNSADGFSDAARDAELLAELSKYFEKQRGYEALVMIHQKPQSRAHVAAVTSPDREKEVLVEDNVIYDFANGFVSHMHPFLRQVGVTVETTEELTEAIVSTIKEYMLTHTEYNSYRGFMKVKENNEVRDLVGTAISGVLEREGHISED